MDSSADQFHNRLLATLNRILDEAARQYDTDEDVVQDFTYHLRDWANRRLLDGLGGPLDI